MDAFPIIVLNMRDLTPSHTLLFPFELLLDGIYSLRHNLGNVQ
jgi:hypothetical protein